MRTLWIAVIVIFVGVAVKEIAQLTTLVECVEGQRCMAPAFSVDEELTFELCYENDCFFNVTGKLHELGFKGHVDVPIQSSVRKNGTTVIEARLRGSIFLYKKTIKMTRYLVPREPPSTLLLKTDNSIQDLEDAYFREAYLKNAPVTHWRRSISMRILDESRSFPLRQLPPTIRFQAYHNRYSPALEVDDLFLIPSDWGLLSTEKNDAPQTRIDLQVQGFTHFAFINMLKEALETYKRFGIADDDLVDIKLLFRKNRLWRILMEYLFGTLSIYFATMAFKNDIGFWRHTKKSTGLSVSSSVSRFAMQFIIFLHLYNFPTVSRVVLAVNAMALLIDGWKVSKLVKGVIVWNGLFPSFESSKDDYENETDKHDWYCFKHLSAVFFPVLAAYAVYDLLETPQVSWWSWFIENAAHGVYVMGFIFMVPQLYINYKLKSVAHLPWRVMVYKTFNTFVDDVFAWFIADVPLTYRIATFRDDICFFVFLYQRYLYRTDYARCNEFGRSYELAQSSTDDGVPDEDSKDGVMNVSPSKTTEPLCCEGHEERIS